MSQALPAITAKVGNHEEADRENYCRPAHAERIHYRECIFSGVGIVMVAEQKYLVSDRADLVRRCSDESELSVPIRILDSILIPGDSPSWGQRHDYARMRPLVRRSIPRVMKPN